MSELQDTNNDPSVTNRSAEKARGYLAWICIALLLGAVGDATGLTVNQVLLIGGGLIVLGVGLLALFAWLLIQWNESSGCLWRPAFSG